MSVGGTLGIWLLLSCGEPPSNFSTQESGALPALQEDIFEEIAAVVNLDFVHLNGMSGEFYFVEILGGGAALVDYDGDGDLDVYLVQGHMLGRDKSLAEYLLDPQPESALRDRLFRNDLDVDGGLRFTDVTSESRIDARGYGMGAAVGDYDGDGCPDIYVLNWGPNQLWHNRCEGSFDPS